MMKDSFSKITVLSKLFHYYVVHDHKELPPILQRPQANVQKAPILELGRHANPGPHPKKSFSGKRKIQ